MEKSNKNSQTIDENLKKRYEELLENEKKLNPEYSNQTFWQKTKTNLNLTAGGFVATAGPILPILGGVGVMIPYCFSAACIAAKNYNETKNPEQYYEINALRKLAAEQGKLKDAGAPFGVGIIFGISSNKNYYEKVNAAIKDLAPKVGIENVSECKTPFESFKEFHSANFETAKFSFNSLSKITAKSSKNRSNSKEQVATQSFSEQVHNNQNFDKKSWIGRFLNWLLEPSVSETIVKSDARSKESDTLVKPKEENPIENNPELKEIAQKIAQEIKTQPTAENNSLPLKNNNGKAPTGVRNV
jgi:hypothetical protein